MFWTPSSFFSLEAGSNPSVSKSWNVVANSKQGNWVFTFFIQSDGHLHRMLSFYLWNIIHKPPTSLLINFVLFIKCCACDNRNQKLFTQLQIRYWAKSSLPLGVSSDYPSIKIWLCSHSWASIEYPGYPQIPKWEHSSLLCKMMVVFAWNLCLSFCMLWVNSRLLVTPNLT